MPINLTYKSGNAVSMSTVEKSLGVDGGSTTLQTLTDKGAYSLFLKSTAMAKGDEYRVKVYEKCSTGDTKARILSYTMADAQSEPTLIPNITLGLGWDMTIQRTGGSNRAFSWSIRRISS